MTNCHMLPLGVMKLLSVRVRPDKMPEESREPVNGPIGNDAPLTLYGPGFPGVGTKVTV